jgi:hypothetical protein
MARWRQCSRQQRLCQSGSDEHAKCKKLAIREDGAKRSCVCVMTEAQSGTLCDICQLTVMVLYMRDWGRVLPGPQRQRASCVSNALTCPGDSHAHAARGCILQTTSHNNRYTALPALPDHVPSVIVLSWSGLCQASVPACHLARRTKSGRTWFH